MKEFKPLGDALFGSVWFSRNDEAYASSGIVLREEFDGGSNVGGPDED